MLAVRATTWRDEFVRQLQLPAYASPLKEAALSGRLKDWTVHTTAAVVRTCSSLGWQASAQGHRLDRLPEGGTEYLKMDVMAFPGTGSVESSVPRWPMPVAVFELENSQRDARVAYSLWKVLCVRADLRVVFAYREDWDETRSLVSAIQAEVIGVLSPSQRSSIGGETMLATGNRDEGETFPFGYFKFWLLDCNLGRFDRL